MKNNKEKKKNENISIFENSEKSLGIIFLLFCSVIGATANTVLFKIALNAFSSKTTNYGFFVSQFSTFLYTAQALIVSIILIWRDPSSLSSLKLGNQTVYLYMGGLDAASATLGAIAGAYCPGGMQTILNQLIIPLTMISAVLFLGTKFDRHQIWGSVFILFGSMVASSNYFFNSSSPSSDSSSSSSTTTTTTTSSASMSLTASVILYFISVVPCAFSNIYKERKMKEFDMNEVHTSTIVSFWQLWIGFIFLPLLSLPSLGGLSYDEMSSQLQDGFQCFLGKNPNDPTDDCSHSSTILLVYIFVNFLYNVNLLAITKRGSAVLLVMSQALSLPLTNIAFTLTSIMGDAAEPLTTQDLIGLGFTCIGFITYAGFGFAHNFLVAQGPPGQMAYAHFEDHNEIVIPHEIGSTPIQLIDFINGSLIRSYLFQDLMIEDSQVIDLEGKYESSKLLSNSQSDKIFTSLNQLDPIEIQKQALNILKQSIDILERQIYDTKNINESCEGDNYTSNQIQKNDNSEEIITDMLIKYTQLFQNDPINAPRKSSIDIKEKNQISDRSDVISSETELKRRNKNYGT